jgi:DNA-binding CsgD family transcriptional regulator
MNLHTDKEFFVNNSFFAFKLRNLYGSDKNLFHQVSDYLPNCIHINKRENLDYTFYNINSLKSPEMEVLFEKGNEYLSKISCPLLLEKGIEKIKFFEVENSHDATCSFVQGVKMHNSMTYVFTNKLLLDEDLYFNISNKLNEFGGLGRIINSVFHTQLKDLNSWQRFLSLTKQEKRIIRLLANGECNKTIGGILFISTETVKTHRKNIYKKLDIHNIRDVIHIAMTLDFLR